MRADAYAFAWKASAAIGAMYRPAADPQIAPAGTRSRGELARDAYDSGDVHAMKLTEVALESDARGNRDALRAARLSSALAEP